MPWDNSPEKRARDAKVYRDPEYLRNRAAAKRRAGGRCEQLLDSGRRCGSRDRVQVDHVIPVTQHGTHHLDNLRVLCKPCHDKKTAQEGGGYRKGGQGRRGRKREADPVLAARTKWLSGGIENVNPVELGRDRVASIFSATAIRRIHVVTARS